MPKSKAKSKRNNNQQVSDPVAHSKVVKAGYYDGTLPSKDFVVSGHSTGASTSEMEALSHQVSRDAGAVPAYPTDDYFRAQKPTIPMGQTIPEDERDTADLGGPELYGPEPDLLEQSSLREIRGERSLGRRILRGSLGILGASVVGAACYGLYRLAEPKIREKFNIDRETAPA